jgi:hypothetical protein
MIAALAQAQADLGSARDKLTAIREWGRVSLGSPAWDRLYEILGDE